MMVIRPSVSLRSITLKTAEFNLERGLVRSSLLPWVPVAVDSTAALEAVRSEAPVDGVEVVEWMQLAAADNAVFDAMSDEYNRLGSQLLSGSGDAYIPGVRVGDLRGESVRGSTVTSRGYGTVITPQGNFQVPVGGKATFAKKDILAWAALPRAESVQWNLTLLQWKDLAKAPVKERVRFASSQGLVAPNFFSVSPRFPVPLLTMRIGLTSDKSQTVALRGRGVKGSFENVLFEEKFNVDAGESEVVYNVFGFPTVPSFTLELAPSDNTQTILDYIDIVPPV
jgi:hypothetical protein